jgi:hypothetical protein
VGSAEQLPTICGLVVEAFSVANPEAERAKEIYDLTSTLP